MYQFEQALIWLRGGRKILRRGWNGKGMFIFYVPETITQIGDTHSTEKLVGVYGTGTDITIASRIDMRYANGKIGPWQATHEDILGNDWMLLA